MARTKKKILASVALKLDLSSSPLPRPLLPLRFDASWRPNFSLGLHSRALPSLFRIERFPSIEFLKKRVCMRYESLRRQTDQFCLTQRPQSCCSSRVYVTRNRYYGSTSRSLKYTHFFQTFRFNVSHISHHLFP